MRSFKEAKIFFRVLFRDIRTPSTTHDLFRAVHTTSLEGSYTTEYHHLTIDYHHVVPKTSLLLLLSLASAVNSVHMYYLGARRCHLHQSTVGNTMITVRGVLFRLWLCVSETQAETGESILVSIAIGTRGDDDAAPANDDASS
jgi:hypothetical protein